MQSMQRKFGQLLSKSPGDNARVSVLLKDYEDADQVLAKIIEGTKTWRDAWVNIINTQVGVASEFEGLYDPIAGAMEGCGRDAAPTGEVQLTRTLRLKETYIELKAELVDEISMIDSRLVKPASDARDCIAPIRKTIKKRENKRLDYEKCQDKVTKLQRKLNRSAKEESSLAKAEQEMMLLAEEFQIADAHLRETLPPIIDASFRLIPPLLAGQVLIQNRLLGLYYTVLHNYCEEQGFPSPAPPMEQVMTDWTAAFRPAQREVEAIPCVARGKTIHQSMSMGVDGGSRKPSLTSPYGSNDASRRSSSSLIPNGSGQQRPLRVPSSHSLSPSPNPSDNSPVPSPRPPASPSFKRPDHLTPTDFTTATMLGQSPILSPSTGKPRGDYFGRDLAPSNGASTALSSGLNGIAKKKPPPPPPPKRVPSTTPDEFVVAQYSYAGQGEGDLSFQEGDRIRIVKKTDTDQDWWVGELGGVRGNFPANYCKAA